VVVGDRDVASRALADLCPIDFAELE
jgi:hypothetical protein